jgi:hypothetical protein
MLLDCDVRALLGDLAVPALVVHARDNAYIRAGHGRYLAEHIPGARYVELASADHVPWACGADIAREVEEFLTGTRHVPASHRPLAAVLFTDIVASTERVALLGDRAWKERLDQHDEMTERQIRRFAGRLVKTTGDGTLATFDGPARPGPSSALSPSGMRSTSSAWTSGPEFTSGRSSFGATTWPGSRFTSPNGSPASPDLATSWCPGRSSISWPALTSPSRTVASTN